MTNELCLVQLCWYGRASNMKLHSKRKYCISTISLEKFTFDKEKLSDKKGEHIIAVFCTFVFN